MKLTNRREVMRDDYRCDFTYYLDELAGLTKDEDIYFYFYHYIMASKSDLADKILPFRVPGGTLGGIWIHEVSGLVKHFHFENLQDFDINISVKKKDNDKEVK